MWSFCSFAVFAVVKVGEEVEVEEVDLTAVVDGLVVEMMVVEDGLVAEGMVVVMEEEGGMEEEVVMEVGTEVGTEVVVTEY